MRRQVPSGQIRPMALVDAVLLDLERILERLADREARERIRELLPRLVNASIREGAWQATGEGESTNRARGPRR